MRRLLLALLALTALSGCGGADASLFATAVQKTQAAGGAEIVFQMKMDVPGTAQPVVMTGTGLEDVKARKTQIRMNVPGAGELEVVGDGFVMYMRSELFGSALGGKEWIKIDLERASESLGVDLGAMGKVGQGASEQLRLLESVSDGVTEEGREEVRGVETTHYSATIDLRDYPGQNLDRLIELTGQSEIPTDVWIDDEQRVRRMEWEQVFRAGPVELRAELIAEYVRFGVPVDIEIPGEDEVFDGTELGIQELEQDLG
jgi:hypothetical protein